MGEREATPTAPSRGKGVVKWFHPSKGFGFITPDEGEDELFVHQSTIKAEGFRSLREGEVVEFDVEKGEDGRNKAVNVTGLDGAPPLGSPPIAPYTLSPYGLSPGQHGLFHPINRRPDDVAAHQTGTYAAGYYYYYPPGPRFHGWTEGITMPQMMARPPRGIPRPPAGHRQPLQTGKSSGFQVVVHNLPWSCTWQQLKEVFNQWEVERADVVVDEYGRSRGFGTVRFTSEADASSAIDAINGTEMEGRKITVRLDRYA